MGECRTVSINEIKKGNPRLCLSPLRYFGKCYQCEHYQKKSGKICESRIENPKAEKILNRKAEIEQEMKKLKAELEELKDW